jgi:hypothetical protein
LAFGKTKENFYWALVEIGVDDLIRDVGTGDL